MSITTTLEKIDHPSHYTSGGIETIDYMRAKLSPEEYRGYLKGQVIKYVSRMGQKLNEPAADDARKALWYLTRFIDEIEDTTV